MVTIKCPLCHKRLMDAYEEIAKKTKVEPATKEKQADYQLKCPHCGQKVNIKIL